MCRVTGPSAAPCPLPDLVPTRSPAQADGSLRRELYSPARESLAHAAPRERRRPAGAAPSSQIGAAVRCSRRRMRQMPANGAALAPPPRPVRQTAPPERQLERGQLACGCGLRLRRQRGRSSRLVFVRVRRSPGQRARRVRVGDSESVLWGTPRRPPSRPLPLCQCTWCSHGTGGACKLEAPITVKPC